MKNEVISKFKEKPKTKIGWWAFGLSMPVIFGGPILGIFAAVIRPLIDKATNEKIGATIGFGFGIIAVLYLITALTLSIMAFRKSERSWFVWTALVLSVIATCFFFFMIIGEFIFPH